MVPMTPASYNKYFKGGISIMDKTFLTIALIVYLVVLIVIGIIDIKKTKDFSNFAVAGKKQTSFVVILSLLATIIGASTTMGITTTVYNIGFPGIWWLLFGAIGLFLQSVFISKKFRSLNADTLPHAAGIMLGRPAEIIIALIIVVSWIGVIAGQLVAMNGVISFITGKSSKTVFIIVSVAVILYTTIGGQMSVVKTDVIQFFIIVLGVITCFIYLYFFADGNTGMIFDKVELLNNSYKPINLVTQFFIIGGVYFLGPDIMSRNLLSKDSKTAKRSALLGGCVLVGYSLIIVLIGMWIKCNISPEELNNMNALMYIIQSKIPSVVGIVLSLGLVSAILSSIDTCVINASSILVKDIFRKDSVKLIRIVIIFMGGLALAFALMGNGDIITFLSNAYSVYTPGVIFPLLIAILCYKKKMIHVGIWVAAVMCGGAFGFIGSYFPKVVSGLNLPDFLANNFALIGMFVSLAVALLSVRWKQQDINENH